MNTTVDLRKTLAKLGIDESQLVEIGIGLVEYDDNRDPFSKLKGPQLDGFMILPSQLDELKESNNSVYVIYNDLTNRAFKQFTADDIARSNGLWYDLCDVCGKYKLCSMANVSDYSSYYENVLSNGDYVCFNCHKELLDEEVEVCSLCHQSFVYDDGYCSDCY